MENETDEIDIHIKDYLCILKKRIWVVISFLVIVLTIVVLITYTTRPVFEATSQIIIDNDKPNVVNFEDVLNPDNANEEYFNTQHLILKSRSLANKLFISAGLANRPEYKGLKDPLSAFLNRLQVKPVKKSRLVRLTASAYDPETATKISNLWADIYIKQNLMDRLNSSSDAAGWLSEKVDELQKKVQQSEYALQKYKEENNIISIKERENIVLQKLSELNTAVILANKKRIGFETRYRQLSDLYKKKGWRYLASIIDNRLIQELKSESLRLDREKTKLAFLYKAKHPMMAGLTSQINLVEKNLAEEVDKSIKRAENEYNIAKKEEQTLRFALESQKKESLDMNKKSIRYNLLLREAEGNRKLFDVLLNRLKETTLTGGLEFNNVKIVDYAEQPLSPVRPNKIKNIILGFVIGLIGGSFIAFFMEYLDDSIKNSEDVERFLDLPFLGVIPAFAQKGVDSLCLVSESMPKSSISEAFRGLRTAVLFSSSSDKELKSIMVTSSSPSEGKSTTASNIAVTLAQQNSKVLLVDCDLRKPSIHKVFGLGSDKGVSNLLVDPSVKVKELIHETKTENLYVMTSGPIPPNPSELLGSKRMHDILQELESVYDKVVFDSPPVLSVTDSTVLGRLVNGVVIVINSKKTSRDAAISAKKSLSEVGTNIIGVALNKVDLKGRGYYQYYYEYGKESG